MGVGLENHFPAVYNNAPFLILQVMGTFNYLVHWTMDHRALSDVLMDLIFLSLTKYSVVIYMEKPTLAVKFNGQRVACVQVRLSEFG